MFPLRVVLVTVTKTLSTLFRIAFAPQQKSYQTGLLFTHKDDCGGAISVTERCCPAPISLAENIDLSDWCSHYTRIRKAISGTMLACVASVSVWFRSKERPRNGISVLAAREMKQEPKTESGGALLLTPFFARSLTLAPRSLLLNRAETLATQARYLVPCPATAILLQNAF